MFRMAMKKPEREGYRCSTLARFHASGLDIGESKEL